MKAKSGCYSFHFSCSRRGEDIYQWLTSWLGNHIAILGRLSSPKPEASSVLLGRTPSLAPSSTLWRKMPTVRIAVTPIALVLVQSDDNCVPHFLWYFTCPLAETKDFMHLRDDVSSAALQVFGRAFPTSFNFRAVRESCLTLEGLDSCQAPPSQKGTCKTGEKAGGKRTTSLFNSCWSNNTKTLHVFVAPFFRCFKEVWMDTGTKHFREISSQSYGIYREF